MIPNDSFNPSTRLRRLRRSATMRDMLSVPMPGPEKFIYPVFATSGTGVKDPIEAMPGQCRWSVDRLPEIVETVASQGVRSVLLFGVPESSTKSEDAAQAYSADGLVPAAIQTLRREFPDIQIFTDVCICAYTADGHCELPHDSAAQRNDRTLDVLGKMAVCHAQAGADCVAPSAMMDGQVAAIRQSLDQAGLADCAIMSYSTKFASAMYGPFRDAAGSAPGHGDRSSYQADYRDARTAIRESHADAAEGADILMVKPSLFYLDLIHQLRESTDLPVAAYNVSGEYAMLCASAEKGYGDLKGMVRESIYALARAGTDIVISYWANQYKNLLG
ncbi:MAG: porphobilinogen synthase [Verrucomicrobiota bacterium]